MEIRIIRGDGEMRVCLARIYKKILPYESLRMFGSLQDITEGKQAENALKESEAKYRKLFEMESDALFLIDARSGTILDANLAAVNLYGYSLDELRNIMIKNL